MTNTVIEVANSSASGIGTVLWPVIVGGVIGLLGSILVPWVQDKIDRNRQRRQKLEALRSYIGEIRYYAVWSKTAKTFINEFQNKFAEIPKMTAVAKQEYAPVCAKLDELISKLDAYLRFADTTVNYADPTSAQGIGENKRLLQEIAQLADEIEVILKGFAK